MYTRRLVFGLLVTSTLLAQAQDAQTTFQVTGAVKQPLTLSADDLCEDAVGERAHHE